MATRSVLNEDTGMHRVRCLCHADLDVLDGGSLRGRPVNTLEALGRCNSSAIDNQVTDLPKKDIGRRPTMQSQCMSHM